MDSKLSHAPATLSISLIVTNLVPYTEISPLFKLPFSLLSPCFVIFANDFIFRRLDSCVMSPEVFFNPSLARHFPPPAEHCARVVYDGTYSNRNTLYNVPA